MLSKTLLLAALTALAATSPVRRQTNRNCGRPPNTTQPAQPGAPVEPTLPINGGATELPSPQEGLVLKHILLGHGIQNYTCATTNAATTGTATGALAVLYDATALFPGTGPGSVDLAAWDALSATAALDLPLPLTMSDDTSGCVSPDHPGADPLAPFVSPALPIEIGRQLRPIGRHYFTAAGVPTFDLDAVNLVLASGVLDKIAAPAGASAGPDGQPAVPWLRLGAVEGGPSVGLAEVYRVNTVGGTSLACTAAGTVSVPYTAMYWMYG